MKVVVTHFLPMLSSETLGLWNFLARCDFYFQTYFGYEILDIVLC